jgi:putative tryptophan/tyrosine transport system substrate-binding protein
MRRREFVGLLGSAAAVWPLAAHAQHTGFPVIGFLHASAPESYIQAVAAFRKGLSEAGYVEGRNVAIEFRWAYDDASRFSELAADLVRRQVAVIVTPVGTATAIAAKTQTTTIPIVFSAGTDAVKAGLIASYNRPGGNVTGISLMSSELGAKRLGLLIELLPQARRFGLLVNPNNRVAAETQIRDVQTSALATGREFQIVRAANPHEIDAAFAMSAQQRIEGLVISADPMFNNRRIQLATLGARYTIPAIAPLREFVEAGGLMSYGPSNLERYRMVGVYTGRVLKGEKPAEMPVQRPTAFQLVINMQTARALGVPVPPTLLAHADEVIE